MGIELQSAPHGHQRVGGAHGQAGKPEDASQSDGTLGFAALMGLMACEASDSPSTLDAGAASLPPVDLGGTLVPPDANALLVSMPPAKVAVTAQPTLTGDMASALTLSTAIDSSKFSSKAIDQGPVKSLAVASAQASAQVANPTNSQTSSQTIAAMPSEQTPDTALPRAGGNLTSQQFSLANQVQVRQDPSDLAAAAAGSAGFGTAASTVSTLLLNSQEAGIRQPERPAKHLSGRFGSVGDGVYGQPMPTNNPADAMFQVPSTSAAVASTAVAETVSYWASQGVQSASLQLDGFGDEPVEVRISVNGDMAQVDFRTNQPEVRQAIEGAASQLKDMLSSQGMQLAGLSIGTSGRGGSQDKNSKAPSDARKVTLVKPEAVETARVRVANLSVGQSLDLFV